MAAQRGMTESSGERGKTTIADMVVSKIAGMAAREVPGVYALGAGMSRALGAMRDRLTGSTGGPQGVGVEVGERQAAVDLDVIAEYGVSLPDLATGIRHNVVHAVEDMCGLEVTEVNIAVDDLHVPGEEPAEAQGARVR